MPRQARGPSTLTCFLEALQGLRLVVELKRDVILRGTLESLDDGMSLTLSSVTCETLQGKPQQLELMHVRGRAIRYIHFPGKLEPNAVIVSHRKRVAQAAMDERRKHLNAAAAAAAATADRAAAAKDATANEGNVMDAQ